jgi:hypothetical protein
MARRKWLTFSGVLKFSIFSLAVSLGGSAADSYPSHSLSSKLAAGRFPAAGPSPVTLTGTIQKDNEGEGLTFNVKLKSPEALYLVEGSTENDQGFVRSDLDFNGIRVAKEGDVKGKHFQEEFTNR